MFLRSLRKKAGRWERRKTFIDYLETHVGCFSVGHETDDLRSSAVAYDNFGFLVYAPIITYARPVPYFDFCFERPPSFALYENLCEANPEALDMIVENEHYLFFDTFKGIHFRFSRVTSNAVSISDLRKALRKDFLERFPLYSFTSKLAAAGRLSDELATRMAKRYPIQHLVLTCGQQSPQIQEMLLRKNSAALFFIDAPTEEQAVWSVFKNPQAAFQVRSGAYPSIGWLYANYDNLEKFPAAVCLQDLFRSRAHLPKTGHDKMRFFNKFSPYENILAKYGITFDDIYEKAESRVLKKIKD
jgi:hypothetical protein